jgi:glycerophosphoryl diester phosphodiesterase
MNTPLSLELPLLIGHRGAAAHAPENTLAGFREGARQGVSIVEFDATISGDMPPEAIIIHDDTLERTTNGSGLVDKTPLAELRKLDAGDGEKIPTLEEAAAEIHRLGLKANVEIKVAPGRDRETAETVMAVLERCWPENAPVPLISSLSTEALAVAMARKPEWPRGWVLKHKPANWRELAVELDMAVISFNVTIETPEEIAALKASGRHIMAFTVNDPVQAAWLLSEGIAGIFSDTPQTLMPVFAEQPRRIATLR